MWGEVLCRLAVSSEAFRRAACELAAEVDGERGAEEVLMVWLPRASRTGICHTSGAVSCGAAVGREGSGGEATSALRPAVERLTLGERTGVEGPELISAVEI